MADNATRHFLPWVRQGAAAGIKKEDSLGSSQAAEVSLPIAVQFANFTVPTKEMRLYGPADVTAIDPRQIVRIQPSHLTTNFESNFFPLIEFDRPDFPWLFTPAKPGFNERLRPWICLVVVRKQEGVTLGRVETSPLPVLEISPARVAAELPDLEESWAWVHAQVVGSAADTLGDLKNTIETQPARTVSRLLCPRRLDPDVAYTACVVPAFDVGRKAALGTPVTTEDLARLAPAWLLDSPMTVPLQLPVFYSWQFTTGPEGDFESLVRDLQPRPLPDTVGTRPLDLTRPGFSLPSAGVVSMKGMLQPPESPSGGTQPPAVPASFQAKLAAILNAPADAQSTPSPDPVVAPPIYGSPYPPRDRVAVSGVPPHWINDLNLDPRNRVAAGFGTRIVQEDQEHLMASAWQQVDAIRKENDDRRRRQLAVVNRQSTWERQVSKLAPDGLLQVTGLSLAKVAVAVPEGQRTVAWQVSGSESPGFGSAILRRVARPRGPINRRALTPLVLQAQTQARPMVKLLGTLPDVLRAVPIRPTRLVVGTMVTIRKVSASAGTPQIDHTALLPASIPPTPVPRGQRPQVFEIRETQGQSQRAIDNNRSTIEPRLLAEFRQAAAAHLTTVIRGRVIRTTVTRVPDMTRLTDRLQPRLISVARSRAAGTREVLPPSDEDQILAHPQFPAPMSERLIELAPDFLLPGLDTIPANTVTLVQPNTRFIEAFMVGLNHEMGRELLWREYPTDQRGTYFRFFWNRRGAANNLPATPINQWNLTLGRNPSGAGNPDQLVLLVRGELFRRYPSALIYAAKATGSSTAPKLTAEERYPLFRGSAPPDVTFFGFDLTEAAARGSATDPGWLFVIQQQPGEPSFGLDMPDDLTPQPPRATDWNQLTWRHLVQSAAELRDLSHVKVGSKPGAPPPALPDTSAHPPGAQWGTNGAHMARITLQKPVRIAILASKMLPPPKE